MKNNRQIIIFLFIFLAILPILIFRDYTANNELKYLSIVDEAIEEGHIFAFYNHGVPYADKPPLYFWIMMIGKFIFGKHIMFCISLLSVIPALVILYTMNSWLYKYYDERAYDLSSRRADISSITNTGTLLLSTTAFFIACMIVLRMDMLMTMFIVLSLYTFYKMYIKNKYNKIDKQYRRMQLLLPIYIFLAIFSKGAVGFILPILVIIIFLLIKGEIKQIGKYLGLKTWGILASLCLVWFLAVYFDGGKEYLNNLLFNQTVNRAVNAFHHKKPFYYYGIIFWYVAAPWSVLAITTLIVSAVKKNITNDIEKFFMVIFLTTIISLSMVSSKLEVYLLPCFPFLMYLTVILLHKNRENIFIKISAAIPAVILIIIFIGSLFISRFEIPNFNIDLSLWAPLQVFTAILLIGGIISLYFIFKSKINNSIFSFSIALFLFIFLVSFSLPKFNNYIGARNICEQAYQRSKAMGIDNISMYGFKIGKNFDTYFKEFMKLDNKPKEEIRNFKMHYFNQEALTDISNSILIVETKDLKKDTLLQRVSKPFVKDNFGTYTIIEVVK